MRVVIDTNVFVSGIHWSGPPHQILMLWQSNFFQLVISEDILSEIDRILTTICRNRDEKVANAWLKLIITNSTLVNINKCYSLCRDPDDNKFIDCALGANADYLISGDIDLLILDGVQELNIVSPSEFMKLWSNS